jgi:osmotically-inducible protein OsmY
MNLAGNLMKKLLLIFISITLLPACVPVAAVGGAAAVGGTVASDNRTMETMWQDRNMAYQAQLYIDSDGDLRDKANISAYAFDHVLLLVGQAPNPGLRTQAEDLAKNAPNIKRICNQVAIAQPVSTNTKDSWITTKVKTALLEQKGLHSSQIKVITSDGIVYLMGLTAPSQGKLAAEVARKVGGVKKIVKVFEYVI